MTTVTNFVKDQNAVIKDRLSEMKDALQRFTHKSLENQEDIKCDINK